MPYGIYSGLACAYREPPNFSPTKHQRETTEFFLSPQAKKGLLLFHELGSGKTCTALMIADRMLSLGKRRVFILSPGSLRENWVKEYCKVCGKEGITLYEKYTFITYNYAVGKRLPSFDDCLVIIDEAHNLINGMKNQSFNYSAIYEKIMTSNCRILALSGTPIFNYVWEFALLGRLLNPESEIPDIIYKDKLDTMAFMKLFNTEKDGTLVPKNPAAMKRMFEGIISYYPGNKAEMPTIKHMPIIKVEMSEDQELAYWTGVIQEQKLDHPPPDKMKSMGEEKKKLYELLKRLYIMARKKIWSRRASNFYYPPPYNAEKDLIKKYNGWVDHEAFANEALVKIYSPKMTAVLLNILFHERQKHVVFTFYKTKAGATLIHSIFMMCGIRAMVFSGDLDDADRRRVLDRFNAESNRYGDEVKVLIVTEAGAEGISVLEARHMHILESSPRMSKTTQAIGRVARFRSHSKLPEEERVVQVWRYWSMTSPNPFTFQTLFITPEGQEVTETITITNKSSVDELLYKEGEKIRKGILSFQKLLQEESVTGI